MAVSSPRDENNVPCFLVTNLSSGASMNVVANPTTGRILCEDGTSGSGARSIANRDANFYPAWLGASSSDGKTPITIAGNPTTKALLIQST